MIHNVQYINLLKNAAFLRRLLLLFVITSGSIKSIAQTGYIYVHKKSLNEVSKDFSFSVTGGTTSIPPFSLNDAPTQNSVQFDIGAAENGRLWAATNGGALYYRDANSTVWINTGIAGVARVDGGPGGTCYFINSAGTAFSYDGINPQVTISATAQFGTGGGFQDIASGWTTTPTSTVVAGSAAVYAVNDDGNIYKWNGPGTTTWGVYANVGGTQYRVDVNPTNGNVYEGGNTGSVRTIREITPAATPVVTSLGSPVPDFAAYKDIAVNQNGEIYAVATDLNLPQGAYVFKFVSGTTWSKELGSFDAMKITGGVANTLWTTQNSGGWGGGSGWTPATGPYPFYNIFSRASDGTTATYIDDERVRTTTGNSELIPVAPGTYTFTEAAVGGWDLQKILLYDPSANSTSSQVAGTATIDVSAGEVVHVVFQNGELNPIAMTSDCGTAYLETFGVGTSVGTATTTGSFGAAIAGQTSYHYLTGNAPGEDGYYKIVNRANPDFNTWSGAAGVIDHTPGDGALGYMYAVNAGFDKGEFFRRRFTGVIPGATYNFSAWIVDLTATASVNPNVSFSVYDHTTQALLGSYNTGELTSTVVPDAWQEYGFSFTATAADIDLVIGNNGFGGNGNDLAIDDISFALVPGAAPVTTVANTACGSLGSITVTSPATASYEYSINGVNWQQYPNTAFNNLAPGNYTISTRFIGTDNCIATKADFVAATICGNIWNDVNADATNASENPITSGVWVNLVDPLTNDVLQSVQVDASGNYSFVGLPQNTDYQIIVTDADQTGNLNLTASSNPTGYVATGTNLSGVPSTANTTGIINVNSGTSGLTQQNFGIQQPPTAVSGSVPSQVNPGGTVSVTVPSTYFDGNDQNGGTITSITIPTFPTNVTTITIGGTTYTAGTFPAGGVTLTGPAQVNPVTGQPLVPIGIDPINGAVTPVITYTVTDNGGATSPAATVSVPFSTVTVSGNVFNDVNAANVDNSGTANVIPTGMYASLVDGLGNVIATTLTSIPSSGVYSFSGVNAGDYTVVLSTIQGVVGQPAPVASVPTGWANTGEFNGTPNTGNTAPINGVSAMFTVGTTNVDNVNFAIQQPPTAVSGTLATQVNPGGTNSSTVPSSYFDGNDQNGGTVTSITITTFPTFATSITINGTTYTSGTFPAGGVTIPTDINGNPTQTIAIDPMDGAVTSVITYTATDNAGAVSAPATVSVPFSAALPVTLTSFTATKGEAGIIKLAWTTTEETNSDKFELQRSVNSKDWNVIATISTKGESKQLVSYSYTDATPVSGTNYYRLKMIDKDATFAYSRIQSVSFEAVVGINFYPNPATEVLFLKGVDYGKLKSVEIINTHGIAMKTVTSLSNGGIDIATLPNGIYIVKVTLTDATVRTQKIVVNK